MTAQLNLLRHLLKLYNQDQTKGKVHKRTHTGGRPLNHRGGQPVKKTSTSNCTRLDKSSPSKCQCFLLMREFVRNVRNIDTTKLNIQTKVETIYTRK